MKINRLLKKDCNTTITLCKTLFHHYKSVTINSSLSIFKFSTRNVVYGYSETANNKRMKIEKINASLLFLLFASICACSPHVCVCVSGPQNKLPAKRRRYNQEQSQIEPQHLESCFPLSSVLTVQTEEEEETLVQIHIDTAILQKAKTLNSLPHVWSVCRWGVRCP